MSLLELIYFILDFLPGFLDLNRKVVKRLIHFRPKQFHHLRVFMKKEIMYKKSTGFRLIKFSHKHLKWVITTIDILGYMSSVNCLLVKSLQLYFFLDKSITIDLYYISSYSLIIVISREKDVIILRVLSNIRFKVRKILLERFLDKININIGILLI